MVVGLFLNSQTMKLRKTVFILSILASFICFSQAKIKVENEGVLINNDSESMPDISAVLDISSSNKGVLFPRLTTQERDLIQNPAEGLLIYNKTKRIYEFFNSVEWLAFGLASPPVAPASPYDLLALAVTSDQIDLSWSDSSLLETGFILERKVGTGTFTQIANLAADVNTYSDNEGGIGLMHSTDYSYRVKATASVDSDFSNVMDTSTLFLSNYFGIGSHPTRTSAFSIFAYDGNFSESSNAMTLYSLSTSNSQLRFAERSYTYSKNWGSWKISVAGDHSGTKALFYRLSDHTLIAELDLTYAVAISEWSLPASVTEDFILRIQKTSDSGSQLFQILKFWEMGATN